MRSLPEVLSLITPRPIARRGSNERDFDAGTDSDSRQRRAYEARVALWAADLRRLHPSCRAWSDDEFEQVVQRIAEMKVRWSAEDRAD